jgi:polar amino acid transport system ATP-binding protein
VLKGIDLTVQEGEVVCIIGPSGSGKSTFLRCINKLEEVTMGELIVDDIVITDKKVDINKARENIGMVFQSFNLFSHLAVRGNITLAPVDLKKMTKPEANDKARELLRRVGLEDKIDAYPHELSGGQKQRLSIARALVRDSGLLIFDDSFSALDFATDSRLRKALNEKRKDVTRIIVAQRVGTILHADKIIVLEKGVIAGMGTHEELMKSCLEYREIAESQIAGDSSAPLREAVL